MRLKIFLIIILIIIALTIFDIKLILLLTIGTPLSLLYLLLKATIEDILFSIY